MKKLFLLPLVALLTACQSRGEMVRDICGRMAASEYSLFDADGLAEKLALTPEEDALSTWRKIEDYCMTFR